MPTIWLIRHAESETDIGCSTSLPGTAQLTQPGFVQAQRVASTFTDTPDLVVTSSYLRAKQTALPMLQRFPHARYEEWPVHEFTYLTQSLGKELTTIHERKKFVDAYWSRLDHHYIDGEGAESFAQFLKRVELTVEKLRKRDEEYIVVFSHGQFILAILSWLMRLIFDNMQQFRYFLLANHMPNGAMIKVFLPQMGEAHFSPFMTGHLPQKEQQALHHYCHM